MISSVSHFGIRASLFAIISLLLASVFTKADDNNHKYTPQEAVVLWVNSVGPYHNPQETYPYYQLPFCKPEHGIETHKRPSGIGEILEGNELVNSGLKLHFPTSIGREDVCDLKLTKSTAAEFELAVDRQYWYELFLDDLPMWGMVGEVLRDEAHGRMEKHIFTHRSLSISYNQDRIIEVNLTSENPVPIEEGRVLQFTYSVQWKPTDKLFENRFNRYLEYDFFEHKIHWFSVFNSFMMVVFMCGIVTLILVRTLRNDFARYTKDDDIEMDGSLNQANQDESGWKQVYGDVFRQPENLVMFSAMVGTGWQLLVLVFCVIAYAMAGPYIHGPIYEDRGEMVSSFIVFYALSSFVAGFSSGSYFRQYFPISVKTENNQQWQSAMLMTILLFPCIVLIVAIAMNAIAFSYDTIGAIHLSVIFKILAIWLIVCVPLSVAGTIFGRHLLSKYTPPCRVNEVPRPIQAPQWYLDPAFVIPLTGTMPFGSIFIEMYFIFTAFWSYKFYYVYGMTMLMYIILVLVVICTTIVTTYFILNSENHHWQWIAYYSAGSTAGYIFLYSLFYFFFRTQMTGLLQISHYFGYMTLFCISIFFMCGTIGHWGASVFVRKIYSSVKLD